MTLNKKLITMLLLVMAIGAIPITYAASSYIGADCNLFNQNQSTTRTCNDFNYLNDKIVEQEAQLVSMNTELNDRINELTTQVYLAHVVYALETPSIYTIMSYNDALAVVVHEDELNGELATHLVTEVSTDGLNWTIVDGDITLDDPFITTSFNDAEHFTEYLFRAHINNDIERSDYSLIWSGISPEIGNNSNYILITAFDSSSVKIYWGYVDTVLNSPLYYIVEKSVNYGEFEVIVAELDPNTVQYIDHDVVSGEIYSYRVTMVNDVDTQTRSGFTTVLIPESNAASFHREVINIDEFLAYIQQP